MSGEPILAHRGLVDKSALDHPPPEYALRREQKADQAEGRQPGHGDNTPRQEDQQGHRVGEADDSAQDSVDVFHPVYGFEVGQRHAGVDNPVLGGIPVDTKSVLPSLGTEGREQAG